MHKKIEHVTDNQENSEYNLICGYFGRITDARK